MGKRKAENDAPAVEPPAKTAKLDDSTKSPATFEGFGLEVRLLRAILKEKWAKPTLVQAKAIPLALGGKDVIAKSSTGSGKTAAYLIPIIQSTLKRKTSHTKETSTLILVPTKELALQVTKVTRSLASYCGQDIRVENIAGKEGEVVQRARLADLPDVVVATPARASLNIKNGALSLSNIRHLVIDEADLVMSFGFQEDMDDIATSMPKGVQIFLMSATLNTELDTLKGLFCQDPVILELEDEEKNSKNVKQYVIKCAEDEKFLLLYAMFVLKLISGKTIVFTNDLDRCYRVKLFLEQWGQKSCVLNSELPLASRLHIVEEYNKGVYDIIIASDENEVLGTEGTKKKTKQDIEDDDEPVDTAPEESAAATTTKTLKEGPSKEAQKKKRNKHKQDKESGVSRGIDFVNVRCIINFDMPTNYKGYFHRIGRTARAGKTGTAISFVIPKHLYKKHKPTTFPTTEHDEEVLAKVIKHQKDGQSIEPYDFDLKKLEPFRYRFGDALRSVTKVAIRSARLQELRQELLKSEKLSRHFQENPSDLAHLRHDGELRSARIQPHLRHVPDYLLPGGGKKAMAEDIGFVGLQKDPGRGDGNRIRRNRAINRAKGKGKKVVFGKGGKVDPLKTFNARQRGKK